VDYIVGNTPGQLYGTKDVKDVILSYIKPPYEKKHPLFTKWKGTIHRHKIHFECTIHCEAALTLLAAYTLQLPSEQVKDYPQLTKLLQVMLYYDHDAHQCDLGAEHRSNPHQSIKVMLSRLLGAHGDPEWPKLI
jgi:hypothetical protein